MFAEFMEGGGAPLTRIPDPIRGGVLTLNNDTSVSRLLNVCKETRPLTSIFIFSCKIRTSVVHKRFSKITSN